MIWSAVGRALLRSCPRKRGPMNTALWNMGPRFRGDDVRVNVRAYVVIPSLIAGLSAGASHAQTPADFYSRTPLRLLITADPGGSYDTNARLVGRHLVQPRLLGLGREGQQTIGLHDVRKQYKPALIGTQYFTNQHEAQ